MGEEFRWAWKSLALSLGGMCELPGMHARASRAWCMRSLADEGIVRLILDGTVVKTRLDRNDAAMLAIS